LFLGLPLLGLLSRVAGAEDVLAALGRPIVLEALRLSLLTTVAVLVLTLALGSPLALLLARRRFRGRHGRSRPPLDRGLPFAILAIGRRALHGAGRR